MTTIVRYFYRSYLESCGCCSNSESCIEFINGRYTLEEQCYEVIENEEQLVQYLDEQYPELTDYEIGDDCEYF